MWAALRFLMGVCYDEAVFAFERGTHMKPLFTTARCAVWPMRADDVDALLPLLTDTRVRAYLGGPCTAVQAYQKLNRWLNAQDALHWVVRETSTDAVLGLLSVSPHHDPRDMELSYQFLPAYWGHGYAAEALRAALAYIEETMPLKRIVSETQEKNIASCRLLEKLGYQLASTCERFGETQRIYIDCFQKGE